MKIEIDYKPPENCMDCKFLINLPGSQYASHRYLCFLTNTLHVNDNNGLIDEKVLRKSCPFLKTKMGFIESQYIEGVYK